MVALGPGDKGYLTLAALEALEGADRVLLRTERHGALELLRARGVPFTALDTLYDSADDFDSLAEAAADEVLRIAAEGPVCYGVPDPLTDATVARLRDKGASLRIIAGVPSGDALRAHALEAGLPYSESFACVTAMDMPLHRIDPRIPLLIIELNSRLLAGEVKLRLLDVYPPELPVLHDGGIVPLSSLDRGERYDHRSGVFIPAVELSQRERYTFADLLGVMRRLRDPVNGCPWDTKQTHDSLRQYLIEEAYEVVDAIQSGDMERIADELGDVLLQVVFHAQIGEEHGNFSIGDVTTAICRKMIQRHAHIWGDVTCRTPEEVILSWEAIKKKEKGLAKAADTMRDIPAHLPALMRAYKVQNKAKQVGFDWDSPIPALSKVLEEADEVRDALAAGGARLEEELGDLLFAAANVARLSGLQPELALARATEKFIRRFEAMERAIAAEGKALGGMPLAEMDAYWDFVKIREDETE